ncbi:MAG: hypothetical protein JETCAE02_01860 [Anaerolineaceae bacterium]|jgi:F0F1-type ATP synthase assembly protein I|nr:hypothetical protein [Anaerolineae bacterium]MBL1172090.1 AtpZ/AtpI family protein [Chloroflexota bacterium]MBV6465056.1 hypothetical protein [Anaerolineales bacterium]MCE7904731.1 AtpZ/AtpI family protein [Anaerolineae bacterium CFX3]MDL1927084.1 AtpZ/AtpI family protein [Anaerolineae bacterium AMX1]OQY80885.1 MAG: hypothetical protein B6D40_12090 [Anaerolineae bacterium UTCFX3]GJQ37774.1 MAG: hypothetical protein JETCAE02_01860 [Anaerolineaceae bacterium]
MNRPAPSSNRAFNTALTTVIVQVGCLTPIIILGFLFLGQWLDRQFNAGPWFTVAFILGAMPVSVIVLFLIVNSATRRLKSEKKSEISPKEDSASG